jgi:cAMP phosphodiesterase
MRDKPVTVYASDATLEIIQNHIFNWAIWPDFSEISIREQAVMQYKVIRLGQKIRFGERTISAVPAEHTVPAVGYHLDSGAGSLVFTGDTTANDVFWPVINKIVNLRYLIIETAFSNQEKRLAIMSKHLCPSMLGDELAKLVRDATIYISHLKPGQIELIMGEIEECAGDFKPRMLQNNQVFEF